MALPSPMATRLCRLLFLVLCLAVTGGSDMSPARGFSSSQRTARTLDEHLFTLVEYIVTVRTEQDQSTVVARLLALDRDPNYPLIRVKSTEAWHSIPHLFPILCTPQVGSPPVHQSTPGPPHLEPQAATVLRNMTEVEEVLQDRRMVRAFTRSWGVDRIDQARLPLDGVYRPPYSGKGQTVYVLDSGISLRPHSRLLCCDALNVGV